MYTQRIFIQSLKSLNSFICNKMVGAASSYVISNKVSTEWQTLCDRAP